MIARAIAEDTETRHGFLILRDLWLVGVAVHRPRRSPVLVELGWLEQRRSRSASFPVVRSTPRPGVEDDGLGDRAATREGRSNPRNPNRYRWPAAEADWGRTVGFLDAIAGSQGLRCRHPTPPLVERTRMASQSPRDPVTDHLLTPQNAALVVIDYQPSQV